MSDITELPEGPERLEIRGADLPFYWGAVIGFGIGLMLGVLLGLL